MPILSKLLAIHIHPWATCLYAYTFVDSLYLDMYVYGSLYMTYIYLEGILVLMFLRNFVFELNCIVSWWYVSHNTCTLILLIIFSWFCFHEYDIAYIDFECLVIMWFTYFSWNIFLFYSLLEGFRTSLQIFLITSSYSSLW